MGFMDISEREIKEVKKIFKQLDYSIKRNEERKAEAKSDEDLQYAEKWYQRDIEKIKNQLYGLYAFEVTYDSFSKYVKEEKYLDMLKAVYDSRGEFIESHENFLRLKDRPAGSKRAAIKELEGFTKNIKKQFGTLANILDRKGTYNTAAEAVYVFRDWLINDFDDLIDTIEPVRQEYIISRKGNVKEEEVEEMLQNKFEEYHLYKQWVTCRQIYACVYYPGLKIK